MMYYNKVDTKPLKWHVIYYEEINKAKLLRADFLRRFNEQSLRRTINENT
jgi:parvulin-like peptidyl-prolyl isomerase